MRICGVIPVKPLRMGKSRLSSILSENERADLNKKLFLNTLKVIKSTSQITDMIVISHDLNVLSIAEGNGAIAIKEEEYGLNHALEKATQKIVNTSIGGILVIPVDLPFLTSNDLEKFLSIMPKNEGIIISPDRRGEGTNLLFVTPPGAIEYSYGKKSFQKHIEKANKKGITVKINQLPDLEFDLDLPEDYKYLKDSGFFND